MDPLLRGERGEEPRAELRGEMLIRPLPQDPERRLFRGLLPGDPYRGDTMLSKSTMNMAESCAAVRLSRTLARRYDWVGGNLGDLGQS